MAMTVVSVTEKKLKELAKTLGRSKMRILKDALQHYADELEDLEAAMDRFNDLHASLINHEEA